MKKEYKKSSEKAGDFLTGFFYFENLCNLVVTKRLVI